MNNKVVYGWYANHIPFYIGIGTVERSKSLRGRNRHCKNKRLKAERENCFEVRILYCNLSWKQACELEISLISLYGRIDNNTGILTNMTDGGDGLPNPSRETREKLSKVKKGSKVSPETREKISKAVSGKNHPQWGKSHSQSARDKMSKSHTGKVRSQSIRDKISKGLEGNRYGCKPVMTPAGRFESSTEAYLFYKITRRTFINWLNNPKKPEFYRLYDVIPAV